MFQSVVPSLYKRVEAAVVQELSTGQSLMMEHYLHLCYLRFKDSLIYHYTTQACVTKFTL